MTGNAIKNEKQSDGPSTEECRRMVDKAITGNSVVKFMLEKLEEVGNYPMSP